MVSFSAPFFTHGNILHLRPDIIKTWLGFKRPAALGLKQRAGAITRRAGSRHIVTGHHSE